jgi:hypothetical protein
MPNTLNQVDSIPVSKHKMNFFSLLMVSIMVFYGLIFWSPLVGTEGRGIYFALVSIVIVSMAPIVLKRSINNFYLYLILAIFLTGAISSVYWATLKPLFANIWVLLALLLYGFSTRKEKEIFINIATVWIVVLLIGAYIAFLIAALGVDPLGDFPNPDGRPNYIFYGTLSNVFIGDFIRPAGIYDEPGSFSLLICFIVAMRYAIGKSNVVSIVILFLGLITTSLAHVIFLLLFLIANLRLVLSSKKALFFLPIAFVLLMGTVGQEVVEKLTDRFANFVSNVATPHSNEIEVGNRTRHVLNSIEVINRVEFSPVFGFHSDCFRDASCGSRIMDLCCEPLVPFVKGGIMYGWFYYLVLLVAFISPIFLGSRGIVMFALGLLLLQRPGIYGMGGSMFIIFALGLLLINNRAFFKKKV